MIPHTWKQTPVPTWLVGVVLVLVVLAIAAYHMSHVSLGHTLAAPVVCPGGGRLSTEVGTKLVTPQRGISNRPTNPYMAYDVTQHCIWPDGRSSQVDPALVWAVLLGMEVVPLLLIAAPALLVRESRRLARLHREEERKQRRRAEVRARYEQERSARDDR